MRLATWNVNSIRTRAPRVLELLERHQIDVLAMQEIKCRNDQFPLQPFEDAGYQVFCHGVNQWNGVAAPASTLRFGETRALSGAARPGGAGFRDRGLVALYSQRSRFGRSAYGLQTGLAGRAAFPRRGHPAGRSRGFGALSGGFQRGPARRGRVGHGGFPGRHSCFCTRTPSFRRSAGCRHLGRGRDFGGECSCVPGRGRSFGSRRGRRRSSGRGCGYGGSPA